jgi:UDPglucose--hexose-1-phosphate uridylyltransferase
MKSKADSFQRTKLARDSHAEKVTEQVETYQAEVNAACQETRLSSIDDTRLMLWRRSRHRPKSRRTERSIDEVAFELDQTRSHSRQDMLTGDWTLFAPNRDDRPNEYASLNAVVGSDLAEPDGVISGCPFCAGAEDKTPEAIWSARLESDESRMLGRSTTRLCQPDVQVSEGPMANWDVRVVPNKFPAVSPTEAKACGRNNRWGLFPMEHVVGGHEVIIESSQHAETMTQMDSSFVYLTLLAYKSRIRHWRSVPGVQYIGVFKNCGPEAGASLRHSHSQLVATSQMPHHVQTTLQRAEAHRARTGCTLGCDLLRAELDDRVRVIGRADNFVAFCPFSSRFPGMIRVTSQDHVPHFEDLSDSALDYLSSFLWRVLRWMDAEYPGKAYNYLLRTCPPGTSQPSAFQWSLDVFPRLSKTAGFEWGSHCMINSTLPEVAAMRYRAIAAQNDPRRVLAVH